MMFDSRKISENMLEDLIMSLGGFCHIARALIYCIADFWPCIDRIYMSSPTSIQNALVIVVLSARGEIGNPARSVSGHIGTLAGLILRPTVDWSRSLSTVDISSDIKTVECCFILAKNNVKSGHKIPENFA